MSKKSSIGHFARIPVHVARANVSETAKGLWRELAFVSSPECPRVWVNQKHFAKLLDKCVKTVQRALKELIAAGLVKFSGWMQHGRYKTYMLAWKNFFAKDGQNCPAIPDENVLSDETLVSEHAGQKCPTIIREEKKSSKQNNSFSEQIAARMPRWQERFQCLDGKNGRPTLEECIDQGLSHKSRHNYDTPWAFLETWLRNAMMKFMAPYQQELAAGPSRRESMRAYEEMRAKKQAEDFAHYWPIIQERDRRRTQERLEEIALLGQ